MEAQNPESKPKQPENQKGEAPEPRVGVYVCHCGGNISDVVDVKEVTAAAGRLPGVSVSRLNMFMCSDPGQEMIAEDIRNGNIDRVVVAACSPSLHETTFRGLMKRAGMNPFLLEQANIREQVSWVSAHDSAGATEKAVRLVGAAVAKARMLKPLAPIRTDARRRMAVIGGGVSGLRAARDLSRRGFEVELLERSPFLGGRVAQLERLYPTGADARELLHTLIDEVIRDPNIRFRTLAEVTGISGYVGNFFIRVRVHPRGVTRELTPAEQQAVVNACPEATASEFDYGLATRKAIYTPYEGCYPPAPAIDWKLCTKCGKCAEVTNPNAIDLEAQLEETELNVGAIVLATGFDSYQPRPGEFGYGELPGVVTLPQLVRLLDPRGPTNGALSRNGQPVRRVAFIYCVGSRQVEGVHEPGPDGRLNTHCSRYCCTAALQAANEIRERFPQVEVFQFYQDIRTYGRGHEDLYEEASRRGVLFFRHKPEEPPVVRALSNGDGFPLAVTVKDTLTWGEELEAPADLVVLVTGMVPHEIGTIVDALKLPRAADGFLQEVHPKLRPVETPVSGIFLAGTCQAPMDIGESCAGAGAAAAKASAMLDKGYVEQAPFVASVNADLCRGSGKCLEECAYQNAISLVEMEIDGEIVRRAEVNAALCTGCGMCVPACPERAIEVEGSRIEQFDAMVEALVAAE